MKLNITKPFKNSYWQDSVEHISSLPSLSKEIKTDIAIIGGGFVGLWTAINIKELEPDCKVTILEQNTCGSGASGRNGGMAMSWWPKIGTIYSMGGRDQALFLGKKSEQAIYELGEFCARNSIDAHFTQKGWLWTATNAAHIDSWNGTLGICEKLGVNPFERVSKEDVQKITGSKRHLAAVFERSNATVQPFALTQGIKKVALEKGIEIYENSGVESILKGNTIKLKTQEGTVLADRVIIANNVWAAQISELSDSITPVNSSVLVTEPLGQKLNDLGWTGGESITDSRIMVGYYRTTRDGRIAYGKGTGSLAYQSKINDIFSHDANSIGMTKADFIDTYPSLSANNITHAWSGPIDRTYDSLPMFDKMKGCSNIFYGIGWSGNGVSPSQLGGKILASLALDLNNEWSTCSLVGRTYKKFPPEPIRYIGGNLVRKAVVKKDLADQKGKSLDILSSFLVKMAPAGLEDKV